MRVPIRILYVDDSSLDRDLVRDALEKEHDGFQLVEAASRAAFETRLAEAGYDLVLSDFNILGFEGLQVIDAVHAQAPGVPVVIVTGTGSEEIAVAAMQRGAADYVIKSPQHIRRLPQTIHSVLDRARLEAERAQANEQLRAQADQITQIMRSVPDGVLLLDRNQRILLANPAAQACLALLADAQQGEILTHLADRPLSQFLTSPPLGRWHELQKNQWTYEALARPLLADVPTAGGWVLVLRDVTQQRLVQQQFQSQERLAAVGQLAAGISHDFNNLMGVVVLYVDLLSRSPAIPARDQARLAIIKQQVEQATKLIRQILDFSRRGVLEQQPLDLGPLLLEEVKLLQRLLPDHIEIAVMCEPDEHVVQADPTRIRQILLNLALNARDAMPQGGKLLLELARMHLRTIKEQPIPGMEPGAWIRLTVSDTGSGIPPQHLEHIFEPFFTTKAPGVGTGLGLAQVHGIVAQHGGHIGVASQAGVGTSFSIYLPALALASDTPHAIAEMTTTEGNRELVLIVEDSETLRAALANFLQMWNYRTVEAANGVEALTRIADSTEPVALVLSDAVMPQMGGVALLHALRQRGDQTPMIMLTGHPLDEMDVKPLRNQGLYAWLLKPPDLAGLARTIQEALATGAKP